MTTPPTLPQTPLTNQPAVKKKSGCMKWFIGGSIIGILIIIVLFVVSAFFGGKERDKMTAEVKEFLQVAQSQGLEAAYERTSATYQARVSVEEMKANFGATQPEAYLDCDWNWGRDDDSGRTTLVSESPDDSSELPPIRFSFEETDGTLQIADIGKPIKKPEKPEAPESADGTKTLFSFSTAKLKDISLTTKPTDGSGVISEFADNVKGIYLCGQLVRAMDGTKITVHWYNLDVSSSKPALSKSMQAGSSKYLVFSLVRTADFIQPAPYRIDVVIAGKVKHSLSFTIRRATIAELRAGAAAGDASDALRIYLLHREKGPSVVSTSEALDSLKQAVKAGHPIAQFHFAALLGSGDGMPRDEAASYKMYRKAAAQGHSYALFNLAWHYVCGNGSEIEIAEALSWTRKTAETGDPVAVFSHGLYLLYGKGVPQDKVEALKLLESSAEKVESASFLLARIYEVGHIVPKNPDRALHWYKTSAARGNPKAIRALQRLSKDPQN